MDKIAHTAHSVKRAVTQKAKRLRKEHADQLLASDMSKRPTHRPRVGIPDTYAKELIQAVRNTGKTYKELGFHPSTISAIQSPTARRPRTYSSIERVRAALATVGVYFPPPTVEIGDTVEYELIQSLRRLREEKPRGYHAIRDAVRQSLDMKELSGVAIMEMALRLFAAMSETTTQPERDDDRAGSVRDKEDLGRPRRPTPRHKP